LSEKTEAQMQEQGISDRREHKKARERVEIKGDFKKSPGVWGMGVLFGGEKA